MRYFIVSVCAVLFLSSCLPTNKLYLYAGGDSDAEITFKIQKYKNIKSKKFSARFQIRVGDEREKEIGFITPNKDILLKIPSNQEVTIYAYMGQGTFMSSCPGGSNTHFIAKPKTKYVGALYVDGATKRVCFFNVMEVRK